MRLAVLSDLHLGEGGPSDSFGHDDAEFLAFLRRIEADHERIVLLGDVWETLTSSRLGDAAGALARARAHHRELAARFRRPAYAYVHGNHDWVAAREGVPSELRIAANGVRVLFTHGHEQDLLVRRFRWLSELGVWLGAHLRRVGLASLYRAAQRLDVGRERVSIDPAACDFQRWAIDLARTREADVVVTGHTHVATRGEHGDRLFLNSGTCSEGQRSFLSIDTATGRYDVIREGPSAARVEP
jgi:predicted phosphodiesterase